MSKPILELIKTYAPNARTVRIEHKILTVPTVAQAYYESRGHTETEILTRLIFCILQLPLSLPFPSLDPIRSEENRAFSPAVVSDGLLTSRKPMTLQAFNQNMIDPALYSLSPRIRVRPTKSRAIV